VGTVTVTAPRNYTPVTPGQGFSISGSVGGDSSPGGRGSGSVSVEDLQVTIGGGAVTAFVLNPALEGDPTMSRIFSGTGVVNAPGNHVITFKPIGPQVWGTDKKNVTVVGLIIGQQVGWRFCNKCYGLFFGENPNFPCPAGGAHFYAVGSSFNYILTQLQAALGGSQSGWRWCMKCQGLWYPENSAYVSCPAGGVHSQAGSADYTLQLPPAQGQDTWAWCRKCQGLFFNGFADKGKCPAWINAGEVHDGTGSLNYVIPFDANS
jgi:hypothetical protein